MVLTKMKLHRLQRGLTQREIARTLGIPRVYISGFEVGRRNPTPEQRNAISRLLNCPPERLFEEVR